MSRWQIFGLLLCALIYAASRTDTSFSPTPEGDKLVSGILSELSKAEFKLGWQYDNIRREALNLARQTEEAGSFTPPAWMSETLSKLSVSSSAQDVRSVYRDVSEGLWEPQSGESFERGREYVRRAMKPEDDENGKCSDCGGTGRVGDGRIFSECLNCGGDGVVDDSDRKEEVDIEETSNSERSGDHLSRGPTSVSVGSGDAGSGNRVRFPRLKRLLRR